jgi:hypothetical protein
VSIAHPPKQLQNGRGQTVDRFIDGAKTAKGSGKKDITAVVRIPPDVLEQIDAQVESSRVKSSRQAWLMGAIYAKLDASK